MLWDIHGPSAQIFYHSWNAQVRQAWGVPRDTYTYLVESFFSDSLSPLRNDIKGRYIKFIQTLSSSKCKEVRFMFNIVKNDPRSVTRKNIRNLEERTGMDVLSAVPVAKSWLTVKLIPVGQHWRLGLLTTLLATRQERQWGAENTMRTQDMINGLCNT